jgi:hypothetical protein
MVLGRTRMATEKPKPSKGDVAHTIVRAGLSAVPVVGGPAAELFSAIIVPPLTKRRDEWVESIANELRELENEGFRIDNLSRNETFVTIVMHATQIAIRNHQQEKLHALRNAVVNTALDIGIDDDSKQTFLEYVDALTPSHLRVLEFLNNPRSYGERHAVKFGSYTTGGVETILVEAIPELKGKREFYDQLVKDLHARGLVSADEHDIHVTTSETGMFSSRTTETGRKFLAFVTERP